MTTSKTTKKKPGASQSSGRPVLVTTVHRGVFFGYADDETVGETIRLRRGRNVVSWSSEMHGVFGLASIGPNTKCRIGPAVERLELRNVTAIADVSAEAVAAFEKSPWA